MKVIHVSSFPEKEIYILLDRNFLINVINETMQELKCKNYFELSLWINKGTKNHFNGGDIKYWLDGKRFDKRTGKIHPKFMPLWLAFKLLKVCKISLHELDAHTMSYRSGGSGLIVNSPHLPIKITPELESIIIHLFGDGAAGDFTPSYTQKNRDSFNNFITKLINCFGDLEKSIYFTQGKHQVKFPKAITDIIRAYYHIISFHSDKAIIPKKIFGRNKKFKLACLLAFLVDEGGIRDVITAYNKNLVFLSGIRKMAISCGYTCSEINLKTKSGCFSFNISNKDLDKIWKDIDELNKTFPTCNLSFKKPILKQLMRRRQIKNVKNGEVTKQVILDCLGNNINTAISISSSINYSYCAIIHALNRFEKEGIVRKKNKVGKTYYWMTTK